MKKYNLILMMIVILGLSLNAQFSIADTDDFLATDVNPAGLGFDNPAGFSFKQSHNDEFNFEDDYSIFFNTEGLSYRLLHSNKIITV